MLECSECHAKGGGLGGAILYRLDGRYYCRACLMKLKGQVKCGKCGASIFATNDSFQTVNGQPYCKSCITRMIAAGETAVTSSSPASGSGASPLPIHQFTGFLKQLYAENIKPTEQVLLALSGSAGEGLVATDSRVLVLKSGLATGLGTNQVVALPYAVCSEVLAVRELAFGYFTVLAPGYPDTRKVDYTTARRSTNCVTFMVDAWPAFSQATEALRSRVGKKGWRVA